MSLFKVVFRFLIQILYFPLSQTLILRLGHLWRYKHRILQDFIYIRLKLARIFNVTIQANFIRNRMESSEHNSTYSSPPICTNWGWFLARALFFILYFLNMSMIIISQTWIFVTSHLVALYRFQNLSFPFAERKIYPGNDFKGWFPLSRNLYVRTWVKFTFANKIEAMYERSHVSKQGWKTTAHALDEEVLSHFHRLSNEKYGWRFPGNISLQDGTKRRNL